MSKKNKNIGFDSDKGIGYEASIRYLVEKSNQRAWFVAFVSILIAVMSIIAIMLLTPLKTIEPYVIRVDNVTGDTKIITTLSDENMLINEALDKHFISTYVKAREGYFYDMLQKDYTLTQLLSSAKIAKEYKRKFEGKNSIVDIYKNKIRVTPEILSVVLGESAGKKIATVRVNLIKKDLSNSGSSVSTKVITLSYEYYPDMSLTEDERIKNPFGFAVDTYRVDDEIRR